MGGKKINNICKSMQNNKQDDAINLRYYSNVTASARYGSQNIDENFSLVPISPEFLDKVLRVPVKNYDIIRVFGDSMEPFAENGDLVIIDRSAEVKNGDIIIANICGDIYIKKFLRDPIKKLIKLTSLNNFYQDIEITKEEIENLQIVGKVRCKFSINMKVY
ncbi:S24 family peptidase [Campylobacter iguaniorum]|uniref:S24 family peptidase n=1 Tax=Campylobacter iguaniorum TaxID=1244531 RepID=UPI0007C96B7A|nr:S24 family peptidase [Campylobacter iguaniorum]